MASKQTTVDFILEQMADAGDVSARKMFGEYGLYCGRKLVALVCDDLLFVKPTAAGKTFIGKVSEAAPYPGAKPWFSVPGSHWEDSEWLAELVRLTARELPTPMPKAKKPTKPKKPAKSKLAKPKLATSKTAKAKPSSEPKLKRTPPQRTSRRA